MAINNTINSAGPYIGNGSTTTFSYNFRILNVSQLAVFRERNSTVTKLNLNTDYTVSGVGLSFGTITFSTAPLNTDIIYIVSDYKATQLTEFESQGAFFPQTHEDAMDKMTYLIMQLEKRTLKVAQHRSINDLPDPKEGYGIKYDAQGQFIEENLNNNLKKDGSDSGMEADLAMNGNRLTNLPAPASMEEPLRLQELEDLAGGSVTINVTNNDNRTMVPVLTIGTINSNYTIQETDNNKLYRCFNGAPIEIVVPFGLSAGNLIYFIQETESLITFRGQTAVESGEDVDFNLLTPLGYHPYTRNSVVCVTILSSGTGVLAGDIA